MRFLALGGILTAAVMAPGAVQAFRFLLKDKNYVSWRKFNQSRARQYIYYLSKRGMIRRSGTRIKLTKKGKKKIEKYDFEKIVLRHSEKWDGKWRVVIFDIPEAKKKARDALGKKFKRLGMQQLQKSVFVFPFDCKKEIDFVADFFGVERSVFYLESKIYEVEQDLKKNFNLN